MEKYYVNPIGGVRAGGEETQTRLDQKLAAALKALDGSSHLNVFQWFSDSDNEGMRSALETPQPYKDALETMGIFATCSPIRPNPIAFTAVEALSIDYEAGVIRITYIDANNNTPVFDIRPYTPSLDHVQDSTVPGWRGNWPSGLEELGEFDWELIFDFQHGSRQNRIIASWDYGGIG